MSINGFDKCLEQHIKENSLRCKTPTFNNSKRTGDRHCLNSSKKMPFSDYAEKDYIKQKKYVERIMNPESKQRLRDRNENVWLKCVNCNEVKPQTEFEIINDEATDNNSRYNYPDKPQLGFCKDCLKNSN